MADHDQPQREMDDVTQVETTGHVWDGIKELDNPLPRWWLWTWWACIAFAVVYWILMPAWPGIHGYTKGMLHMSDRAAVAQEVAALKTQRGQASVLLANASLEQIERDPNLQTYALQLGQSVFGDNCATCHGQGGVGGKGYANLRDDVWLWGGSLQDIQDTLTVGIRSGHAATRNSAMPAFGKQQILNDGQVNDLTEYVIALSHRPAKAAAVRRAVPLFAQNCAACHGPTGKGNPTLGAPDLTDADWLYGADHESIEAQIRNGRGGVMPAWEGRLSPETIKAMAVYVHANAGGR